MFICLSSYDIFVLFLLIQYVGNVWQVKLLKHPVHILFFSFLSNIILSISSREKKGRRYLGGRISMTISQHTTCTDRTIIALPISAFLPLFHFSFHFSFFSFLNTFIENSSIILYNRDFLCSIRVYKRMDLKDMKYFGREV